MSDIYNAVKANQNVEQHNKVRISSRYKQDSTLTLLGICLGHYFRSYSDVSCYDLVTGSTFAGMGQHQP